MRKLEIAAALLLAFSGPINFHEGDFLKAWIGFTLMFVLAFFVTRDWVREQREQRDPDPDPKSRG